MRLGIQRAPLRLVARRRIGRCESEPESGSRAYKGYGARFNKSRCTHNQLFARLRDDIFYELVHACREADAGLGIHVEHAVRAARLQGFGILGILCQRGDETAEAARLICSSAYMFTWWSGIASMTTRKSCPAASMRSQKSLSAASPWKDVAAFFAVAFPPCRCCFRYPPRDGRHTSREDSRKLRCQRGPCRTRGSPCVRCSSGWSPERRSSVSKRLSIPLRSRKRG